MKVAVLTANTNIYREQEEDKSAKVIKKILDEAGLEIVFMKALPNDRDVLSTIMQRMADGKLADMILTTGGAGCAPDDWTPEATLDIVDKVVPGIPEAMRAHVAQLTKRSMLNRGTAGIRGGVLIVNLPGKPGAVKECLKFLLPELVHAVNVIKGEA